MKIMLLLSSLNAGGAERVAVTLANAWVALGHEVVLVPSFTAGSGQSFYTLDERIQVHWLSQDLPKYKSLAQLLKPIYLRKVMRQYGADVMVSFLTNVNVMAILASRGLGIPLVVSERSNPQFQQLSGLLRRLRIWLYPRANVVMLQTESAAQAFVQSMPKLKRLAVIANPLPQSITAQTPNFSAPKRVLAMGRLVPLKQFDRLIRIFAQLSPQAPEWSLHIYGDGSEEATLTSLIEQLSMQDKIVLAGKTEQPWQIMREAQVFAMTSRLEGFPNVMLEAMANGLPVVCFDCPSGPKELSVDGRYARLVALDDEVSFQTALLQLMQNPALRQELALAGQTSVFARYAQEQIVHEWLDLLKQVKV